MEGKSTSERVKLSKEAGRKAFIFAGVSAGEKIGT
jgi:hypothetical protein